ncbi:hypothetical protein Q4488_12975 [Amphritea sp. 1_MG-2023]|uniref:hypothetical protein n=1 Tax=Amphritea sp. 1_MG-2023 TaxID=3062670 RepID=UPI0026E180BC|nr:hypothetical protein [Amphritea sp. 1_MG-2023]MDO6564301.1 hypothetical protein [Amphritea sp. 1_MG-2023]
MSEDKKLLVLYRVEPGCLGPQGDKWVSEFCRFAQRALQSQDSAMIRWNIVPRNSKTLPEIEYNVVGKRISYSQATRYLASFGKSLDGFEGRLGERIALFIEDFMSRV